MTRGGKLEGLELLIGHQELGYKLVDFDSLEPALFDGIERQRLVARIFAIRTNTSFIATRLPEDIQRIVDKLVDQYQGKTVIIRSNSLMEGKENSFRGIYASVIVQSSTPEKLAGAVQKVYDSFYSERAARYRLERGIKDDKLGILIGEFIEPDYSGIMHTSNPSYPSDLTIEFCAGRNRVVDASIQPFIIDFDKKKRTQIFKSENLRVEDSSDEIPHPELQGLLNIGIGLEPKIGPSTLEFVIKNKEIYIVQREPINDLQEPVDVVIPTYDKKQFIGATQVRRGKGAITLPAVVIGEFRELVETAGVLTGFGEVGKGNDLRRGFIQDVVEKDRLYPQGYILIIPHFYERELLQTDLTIGFPSSIDAMTKNKKAIVTTNCASISSHVMTIARERGIAYAGFEDSFRFSGLHTGDTISIYFKGRKAVVFREKDEHKYRNAREINPSLKYNIERNTSEGIFVKALGNIPSHRMLSSDLGFFLELETREPWEFEPYDGRMGGMFFDQKKRAIVMDIFRMGYQYGFFLSSKELFNRPGLMPLPLEEFGVLIKSYIRHLN